MIQKEHYLIALATFLIIYYFRYARYHNETYHDYRNVLHHDHQNQFYKSNLNINDYQDIIAMRDSKELQKNKN